MRAAVGITATGNLQEFGTPRWQLANVAYIIGGEGGPRGTLAGCPLIS